jgi:hypothetical protein
MDVVDVEQGEVPGVAGAARHQEQDQGQHRGAGGLHLSVASNNSEMSLTDKLPL